MGIIEELDAWLEERNKGKIKSVFFYNTKLVFYMYSMMKMQTLMTGRS
jgi:hypothetical protein